MGSDCNNPGNHVYGNTVRLRYWRRSQVFWYDWSKDPATGERIAEWTANPNTPLTVRYCTACLMAVRVTKQ